MNIHPAKAIETFMRCSAAFEEDQQINFTPLSVTNFQGNSEQTHSTAFSGKLSSKDQMLERPL